jgi:hypothetical protein
VLQRRLASSPAAIHESLRRRRERLESKLRELKLLKRGAETRLELEPLPPLDEEDLDELEDAPEDEYEQTTEKVMDLATAAQTIVELEAEIHRLKQLEAMAGVVRRGDKDRKWKELSRLLQDQSEMFDSAGQRRKLVIFTEHRDTLEYLNEKIITLLGKDEAVVTIHGGLTRDIRRSIQAEFVQNKDVLVLIATDAAGEGINLQRAHLMVNYDLPWNPNRLEQRFGRIHRIGQSEVCHLWNLVADETREGDVYARLLRKIEQERRTLGDGVFDVLGKLFQETSLRQLLIEAVRYGDQPEVRERLNQAVDNLSHQKRVRELLEQYALARDSMDTTQVQQVREEFERAQAKRLQPHFVSGFFKTAFIKLGGSLHEREPLRFEISHVPGPVRTRSQSTGRGPILRKYERITFHKEAMQLAGKPAAEFVCPGHPLMDAVIDLILERFRGLLRQGALLVDPTDSGTQVRALFYLDHSIQDARSGNHGLRRVISRQMQFVEIDETGNTRSAGPAPFLDYEPLLEDNRALVQFCLEADWLKSDLEPKIKAYAAQHIVPTHLSDVRQHREEMISKTTAAVKDRLTKEIAYWDHRSAALRSEEQAGKVNARLNSELARRRADDLQSRLQRRMEELEGERHISPQPPLVIGGALVIPQGLLDQLEGKPPDLFGRQRKAIEMAAMEAVLIAERVQGFQPQDVNRQNLGWDIESCIPGTGKLRFIEVKGRIAGADTITVSRNEILAGLNKPADYWLAVVEVIANGKKLAALRSAVYPHAV